MNSIEPTNKDTIALNLSDAVDQVNAYVSSLSSAEFEYAPEGKWNAGQQLDHLIRSIKPLNLAYGLPVFVLKTMFGLTNRPSKTYAQLVEKYKNKLAGGGRASGRFIPSTIPFDKKEILIQKYALEKDKLVKKVKNFKDSNLDKYILPHPLLGKLTLREMLFFTIYHNQHHLQLMKKQNGYSTI